jgi:hypothetical protein
MRIKIEQRTRPRAALRSPEALQVGLGSAHLVMVTRGADSKSALGLIRAFVPSLVPRHSPTGTNLIRINFVGGRQRESIREDSNLQEVRCRRKTLR